MNNKEIVVFNGESCSFCKNEGDCDYKKLQMIATRRAAQGLNACSSAYFSMKVNCDYYIKDDVKYGMYNSADCICCTVDKLTLDTAMEVLKKSLENDRSPVLPIYGEPEEITIETAMRVLTKELKADRLEGSYYYGWQSNIACTIMDNSNVEHNQANIIAKKFLELIIS
jgi:hypothetical protein